jgi:hypothetical protein
LLDSKQLVVTVVVGDLADRQQISLLAGNRI